MERTVVDTQRERQLFLDDIIKPHCNTPEILEAFASVDRAEFVQEESDRHAAYTNETIRLGDGSTLSQPSLVAEMISLLGVESTDTVLEIGSATGYQASLLSRIAKSGEIYTIEYDPELSQKAVHNIERLGFHNVHVHTGDGAKGIPGKTFDKIIVTAALKEIPPALIAQLRPGGIIVAPIGPDPRMCQMTKNIKLTDGTIKSISTVNCGFVPLYSSEPGGWTNDEITQLHKQTLEGYGAWANRYIKSLIGEDKKIYKDTVESLSSTMALLLERESPLPEEEVLKILGMALAIMAHMQENVTAEGYDRTASFAFILEQSSKDLALMLGEKENIDPVIVEKLYRLGLNTFNRLTQEREARFSQD